MTKPVWEANPPDNSQVITDILPPDFDGNFCVKCGGTLDMDYRCTRCECDHWPAVKRNKEKKK